MDIRRCTAASAALVLTIAAAAALAGEPVPYAARAGLDLAQEAAGIWAADARLIYVENDEPVAADGTAARWGYLFHSETRGRARGYTIRDGRILEAADLEFELDAPPLDSAWVDSDRALAAAEDKAGRAYCAAHGGRLATMLLIRGAFDERHPDASTWAVVYTADDQPALTIVIDAADGKVVRQWKG